MFRPPARILVSIIAATVIASFFLLNHKGFLDKPKDIIYQIISPAQKFSYQTGNKVADYLGIVFSARNIIQENHWLQNKNLELQASLSKLTETLRENDLLKDQLSFKNDTKSENHYILANTISQSPDNFIQSLVIDKGGKDGVEKDAAVIIGGNVLAGKVAEVFPSTAKVLLINDSNSAINSIAQKTRVSGISKGNQGIGIFMEMIPQDKNVEIGEQVITVGLGPNFPRGLLIGEITEIIANDIEVFKKARIKPAANLDSLETVFVLAP